MNILKNIEVIIFDFDGVIINSMEVRDYGFRKIFEHYSNDKVEELISYHRLNGGLSRFHKINYFYNRILKKSIDEEQIKNYADRFSDIMRDELIKKEYIILEWIEFIRENNDKYIFHIASGSEEEELKYICKKQGIEKYFKSIHGSPTHKNEIIKDIIETNNYIKSKTVLIGDSINDYQAASINEIKFIGYNNHEIEGLGIHYLHAVN